MFYFCTSRLSLINVETRLLVDYESFLHRTFPIVHNYLINYYYIVFITAFSQGIVMEFVVKTINTFFSFADMEAPTTLHFFVPA